MLFCFSFSQKAITSENSAVTEVVLNEMEFKEDEVDHIQYPITLNQVPTKVIQRFTIEECDLTNSNVVNAILNLLPSVKAIELGFGIELTLTSLFRIFQVRYQKCF